MNQAKKRNVFKKRISITISRIGNFYFFSIRDWAKSLHTYGMNLQLRITEEKKMDLTMGV